MSVKPTPPVFRRPVLLGLGAAAALALTAAAAAGAWSTRGIPFPSLVVDPYGHFSMVTLPSWEALQGEARPSSSYRVVEVDGRRLEARSPAGVGDALAQRLEALPPGHQDVVLGFERPGAAALVVRAPLRILGTDELIFLFAIYALVAWMVLWSGGVVFVLCERPAARRAYLFWSATSFVFMTVFSDYHFRRWLAPLFSVSTVALPLSALWLAYAFPEPPRAGRGPIRAALLASCTACAAAAAWLVSSYFAGGDPLAVRRAVDAVIVPSLAVLGLSVIVRMQRSTGRSRAELTTAVWGLVVTPLLIALINLVRISAEIDVLSLALPFIVLLFPLAIGYALIRHNILATSSVLTPRMLMVPLALLGLIAAVLAGYAADWAMAQPGGPRAMAVVAGIACFAFAFAIGRRAVLRLFFPATLHFRPSIERLTDQLATLRGPAGIKQAVNGVVEQWLPTMGVQILAPSALPKVAHLPSDGEERLSRGERVWTFEAPWARHLLIPMRSLGELHGVLCVAPKRGAALYTQEDLNLLETMAGLGALALHHARTLEELERLRSFEVEVLRGEKQQALGALSAEICHEMVYPLNYLRDLLKEAARAAPITPEDIVIGREEIGRLERMISSLRMLDPPEPHLEPIAATFPVERALHLLRDPIRHKRIAVSVELPADLKLDAQPDLAVQLFSNLLRNAVQAVEEGGAVGVYTFAQGPDRIVEVWDTGAGIPESVRNALFTRRVTTKEGGQGIGLAVAYRIARNFRWELSFGREAERTYFRVVIPGNAAPAMHEDP